MYSKLFLILLLSSYSLAGWVSKVQYERLMIKESYLIKKVKQLKLPKETVNIFLGKYLRESSIGNITIGDKEKDRYYYIHQGEKTYISKKKWKYAKKFKRSKDKYIKVKYWGKYWNKKLYVKYGDLKPLEEASLGDYHVTFPAIIHTIRKAKLKKYYWFLNKRKNKVIHKLALVNKIINDKKFNTDIALHYFKINYLEAKRRKFKNPLDRAISRHNGRWYNYKYIRLVKKDIKYVISALKEDRYNLKKG